MSRSTSVARIGRRWWPVSRALVRGAASPRAATSSRVMPPPCGHPGPHIHGQHSHTARTVQDVGARRRHLCFRACRGPMTRPDHVSARCSAGSANEPASPAASVWTVSDLSSDGRLDNFLRGLFPHTTSHHAVSSRRRASYLQCRALSGNDRRKVRREADRPRKPCGGSSACKRSQRVGVHHRPCPTLQSTRRPAPELGRVDPADQSHVLSQFLAGAIQRRLQAERDPDRRLAAANQLVQLIGTKDPLVAGTGQPTARCQTDGRTRPGRPLG